jgi:hypothetical protein
MLLALPMMTEEAVDAVMEFRETRDFTSLNEFGELVGAEIYNAASRYLTLDTVPYYTIRSTGRIDDTSTRTVIEATVCLDSKSEKGYKILKWKDGGD